MKKKVGEILEKIRTLILSENFKTTYRVTERNFVRKTLVTFPTLTICILNLIRRSLQSELNNFAKVTESPIISKQTFSAARKKILPGAFIALNSELIREYYSDNKFKKFLGFRLFGVDGSTLQLPESPSIREKYGACSNQKEGMTMSRISYVYDILNGITLDAIMNPYVIAERNAVYDHISKIPPSSSAQDLYLFDRGYPSITLIFFLLFYRKDFVMRCNTSWSSLVNQVLKKGKKEAIIEINPKILTGRKRREFKELLPSVDLKKFIKTRVLIIDLPTGEKEILLTSLLDKNIYPHDIFKELYRQRWGSEENYKFHKVRIEIENFSGKTTHAIEQDFQGTVFTANVGALLEQEAEEEKQIDSKKECKYEYKINKNISISVLKDEIVSALLDPERDLNEFSTQMKKLMKKSTVPIRPRRQFPRIRKSQRKYPMNARRSL